MNILGLSAFYHDSAAALIRDGGIVAAAQEERFTRRKHDDRFPGRAVEYCLREGGIDVAQLATLSRRALPTGSPTTWLVSRDYPSGAQFTALQGIVNFRLSVDESGMPSACHIQQSSHPPEFDAALCSGMMRRARFIPALDKDGKPLASYFRGTAVFKMG
jgi:TonB family protein